MIYERRMPLVLAHKLLEELGRREIDAEEFEAEANHWANLLDEVPNG